jgi:hypothetical protein
MCLGAAVSGAGGSVGFGSNPGLDAAQTLTLTLPRKHFEGEGNVVPTFARP